MKTSIPHEGHNKTASVMNHEAMEERKRETDYLVMAKNIAKECHLKITDRFDGQRVSYLIKRQSGPWLTDTRTTHSVPRRVTFNSAYEVLIYMDGYQRAHKETKIEQEMLG